MSLQDFNQVLVIILLIVLIISIGVVVIQLTRTLKTLTMILEDTHNVTEKVSYLTDHPDVLQKSLERHVNQTVDNVVTEQALKFRRTFARDFLGSIIASLRDRNY